MLRILMLVPVFILALVACGGGSIPANTATTVTTAATHADIYAALPQSKTPDGYYVLGKPDAPVVMTLYSDLL